MSVEPQDDDQNTNTELTESDLDNVSGATDVGAIGDSVAHYGKPPVG
jgi:hypothetical protein